MQVLGGHVEELVEAWTFQRKFGNVQRASTTTDDPEQPPAFQNFIPGRHHNQAGHRQVMIIRNHYDKRYLGMHRIGHAPPRKACLVCHYSSSVQGSRGK